MKNQKSFFLEEFIIVLITLIIVMILERIVNRTNTNKIYSNILDKTSKKNNEFEGII